MAKDLGYEVLWKDRKHYMWFPFSFQKYNLGNNRLYSQRGFFRTHYDEALLYRITDICLERSFMQKLYGTGTIVLTCRADTLPEIRLVNIKNPVKIKVLLSKAIEDSRSRSKVVGKEFWGSGSSAAHGDMLHEDLNDPHFQPDMGDQSEPGFDFDGEE